ncbi:hypothetical protein [Streptomyces sp. NPDC001851]|uniref:hypothetical protein n=1 Tax=Streptomyces sp. NPDC001851 TaxID=3154529 RepID=UPI00331D6C25
MTRSANSQIKPLNVVLRPGSPASRAYARRQAPAAVSAEAVTAEGFREIPKWDLKDHGGRKITDLVFVNRYLGGAAAWDTGDMKNIDTALSGAMSDSRLESVIAQYYPGAISSRMLPSDVVPGAVPARFFKDQAEELAARLFKEGVLGDSDPRESVINLLLPRGVVLVDGFSPGFQPPPGTEEEHGRRQEALIKLDDDADSDSAHGLGGFHESVHVKHNGQDVTVYYAVGVFSEGDNGIVVFDGQNDAWANVVATFYHELNEARTDPDVGDAIRLNDIRKLGWYSEAGQGEIGDLPVNEAESGPHPDISRVFKVVPLANGTGKVPVQLMWSNAAHAPAESL